MKGVLHDCAMAILRAGDSVLMCHRHPAREWFPDVWDFPGGHVEPDETPQQALVRELDEELGVTIAAPRVLQPRSSTSRRSRYGSPFGSSTTADQWRTAVRRNMTMSAGYQARSPPASAWPIPYTSLSSGAPSAVDSAPVAPPSRPPGAGAGRYSPAKSCSSPAVSTMRRTLGDSSQSRKGSPAAPAAERACRSPARPDESMNTTALASAAIDAG